jgi:hypothetical protein
MVVALMDSNKIKIEARFEALKSDLEVYKEFWVFSPNNSIEKALSFVVDELSGFLNKRRGEIDNFTRQAKEDEAFLRQLFEVGPDKASAISSLEARLSYFRNFLLWTYLQKAIQDSHDIRRIAQQREFYRGRGANKALKTLRRADQLAFEYLSRALEVGLVDIQPEDIAPICYFDKSTSINRAPYTQLPLISLPITAIVSETDLFAVAHEMGHFIYKSLRSDIREAIEIFIGFDNPTSKYNQPYRTGEAYKTRSSGAWLEEIFADVFASLVGGADNDQQFRDFLLVGAALTQESFEQDDGDHPPIMIRPYSLQNPDSDRLWSDILATLGIDRAPLAEAETQLREIAGFIREKITMMSGEKYPDLDQIGQYRGDYPYSPQDLKDRPVRGKVGLPGELEKFLRELKSWRKAEWPMICPGCF